MANHSCERNGLKRFALTLVLLTVVAVSHAAEFHLQAAHSRGNPHIVRRSNASSGVAVRLGAGESIQLTFCLRQTTVIQILGVCYSNDGLNDTMAVVVDDHSFMGTFRSQNQSNWGRLWNVFRTSTSLPRSLTLLAGWHSLRLGVLLPSDGIEVDYVRLWLNDEGLTRAMLDCLLLCMTSLPSVPPNTAQLWQQANVRQASYPTKCAEEDNVKVPLYLGGISEYTVTATMPNYVSFANRRDPNTTHCGFLSPILFSFSDFPRTDVHSFSRTTEGANLFGVRSPNSGKQVFRIEFMLQGRSKGHVDAEIGSVLTLHFQKSSSQFRVRTVYSGRTGRLESLKNRLVYPGQSQLKLDFPDFTWRENGTNLLIVEFQSAETVHVKEIIFERRPMRGETVRTVYSSGNVVVEAIEVDFWWRRPETMKLVNGETGETWTRVDFFRISLRVPWNGGYAQVFVMYQDGNVRLASLPPPSVDWIPFGSSVIVGYSDPKDLRPSAPISTVTFYPSTLDLRVQYYDGGSAKLRLSTTESLTQVTVRDIQSHGRQSLTLPFATLRSMYIEDGNSDCDSLLVDGKSYRSITDQWNLLKGKSFFFYRRCESQHLTLSPDIRIDITKMSYAESGSRLTAHNWWWQLYAPGYGQAANNRHVNPPSIKRLKGSEP